MAAPIETPCVKLCALDGAGFCLGCGRSLQEIAAWGSLSPEQRRAVMADLPRRRTAARQARMGAQ